MTTFKPYYDYEKDCWIGSPSAEATANFWAQEIDLIEVRKKLDKEYKRNHPVKYWFKQLFKKLRGIRR